MCAITAIARVCARLREDIWLVMPAAGLDNTEIPSK